MRLLLAIKVCLEGAQDWYLLALLFGSNGLALRFEEVERLTGLA